MENLKPETLIELATAFVSLVVWIIRLEAKVKATEKDLKGLGQKAARLESQAASESKTTAVAIAKLETKQEN